MDDITLKRLLFAKRLFIHGTSHSQNNTELDRFMAIHHFDNSIELFLKIIATKEGISSSSRNDFEFKKLWDEVRTSLESKTPPYNLPLKGQIFSLHDARNLAQHQGDAPTHETVIKYQGYTRDFFLQSFKEIFDIEYDKLYASLLIKEMKIRGSLIEAEQKMELNDYEGSMKSSAKAFGYIKSKERESFSRMRAVLGQERKSKYQRFVLLIRDENLIYGKINSCLKG